jgi:hypothetical protein
VQILNLDELAKVTRAVTIKGVTYKIEEMSVEGFIAYSQEVKKLEEKQKQVGLTEADHIHSMISTIRLAMPECPEDVLQGLKIPQLTALVSHINGEFDGAGAAPGVLTNTEEAADPKS